ncbi:tetratricopeptide repeat protein [Granulicella sp. 5B5]|uniref:tetratricopeptide repeat protein n=1 Tax=Granulicella sp. 5B5 TaxID=1617967 RepID=UPI0015F4402F|nr:tetratricopeptide repeat protein [Granulicella sp. 5B5]QMV17963.1 tetratricopeptide repeat protein [Granulicella sp. 5B5]
MKRCSTKRPSAQVYAALLLAVCSIPPLQAQLAASSSSESILQKRYEAAQKFQSLNELDQAAQQYRIFLADTLGEVAIGRAQAGQYDKAQYDFDEALKLVPDFPMMQLEYARAALRAGHFEHTELLTKALLQNYPGNPKIQVQAHALLGHALLKMDKDAEAKQQFEAAVDLDPTFDNGYDLAVADLNLGDVDGARKIFAEMLSSFGDTPAIHMYFGQAYGNSDFQSDAIAEFQKAIAKDPRLPGAHYSLAVADLATAGDSKLAEAEAALREEIPISPEDAASYAALGHLLATRGQDAADQAQAEAYLKRATGLDPINPDAFLYLGQLYADEKRLPEAEAALRQSIALTHDVSRNAFQVQKAHYLLGRLLLQTGDKPASDREFAESQLLLKQNLSRDQNRLADYLQDNKRSGMASDFSQPMPPTHEEQRNETKSAAAVEAFERRITPAVADSYNNLGAIAGSQQNYAAALLYFQRVAEWEPTLPGLDYNWGRAAFEAGAYDQAIAPLTRYLQEHPQEDGARRVLGLSQFVIKDYNAARLTLQPLAVNPAEASKVQFAYADSLLKTGDASAAIPLLETLEKKDPVLPEVRPALGEAYATLARAQLAQGNSRDAIENLKNAIRVDPENAALRQSLQQASSKPARN